MKITQENFKNPKTKRVRTISKIPKQIFVMKISNILKWTPLTPKTKISQNYFENPKIKIGQENFKNPKS